MIKEFHLFAGIGGGIYGGKLLGHVCCAGVEIDEYCQKILKQRQQDKWFEEFPIYGDLTKLSGTPFKEQFDILCGGFPCQAFSIIGKKEGFKHSVMQHMVRILQRRIFGVKCSDLYKSQMLP